MKLTADSGLWVLGTEVDEPPAVAVLEVGGAVLAWTVDEPLQAVRITFTDLAAADWLWRLVGEAGHVAVVAAVADSAAHAGRPADLVDVVPLSEPLAALRRLAVGHWLRRWWPVSARDGIGALDAALLDVEVALCTAALDDYFAHDTLDSDIAGLLAPHRQTLATGGGGDPRAIELIRSCVPLAEDVGLGDWSEIVVPQYVATRRDDYALAAGRSGTDGGGAIASGVATVAWTAVPPQIFDAAERTVDWAVLMRDGAAVADISVATIGPADGVPVRLSSGEIAGHGALGADGRAVLTLAGPEPVTETQAWAHDWIGTTVIVGADGGESETVRERIRRFARARLAAPGPDAFLAEILAVEADY
ncbi:MAG: hypothetical protein P4L86_16645 [Mycobacterium sp.]|nr:hypothetical protein [Mycobacterium sp.]